MTPLEIVCGWVENTSLSMWIRGESMLGFPTILSAHTVGMGFPIDVAFVDAGVRIVRVVHSLPPWRLAASIGGCAVIELAAGRLREYDVNVGDRLSLVGKPC